MADFCSQCAIEIFGEDNRQLAGIANKGFVVAVLCEECGIIYVDHEGRCMTNCNKKHYDQRAFEDVKQNCTNENPTSKTAQEDSQNPTS